MNRPATPASVPRPITRAVDGRLSPTTDHLAVEEPLELRLAFGPTENRTVKPIAVTMRTPGAPTEDAELAAGFLVAEGLIHTPTDILRTYHCGPETAPLRIQNVLRVELAPHLPLDLARLDRHFLTHSSCGICGKTTLDALRTRRPHPLHNDTLTTTPDLLCALPELLRLAQPVFDSTGGLHASALFDPAGKLLALREDVGRHNALDKLIGSQFLANRLPLTNHILLVSGRASFELLQKAAMAGIPIVAAVGAPSSLAVDLAEQFNITLVGFLKHNRFNIYTSPHRITSAAPTPLQEAAP